MNEQLVAEKAAIEKRIAAASETEKPVLQRQFSERLAHLEERLKEPPKE